MATATLRSALDQPFPAGRAWAESALWRLGLHPDAELDVRHVAQGWMRLGVGDDATLVDTLFVLTDTQLGFGQVEVETTDPHWVPLSSIVAIDLIEGVPYPLEAIEVQFAGGLAIFVGWPPALSEAVLEVLRPGTVDAEAPDGDVGDGDVGDGDVVDADLPDGEAVDDPDRSHDIAAPAPQHATPFTADVPPMPPPPIAALFGSEPTPSSSVVRPDERDRHDAVADDFFSDLEATPPDASLFSLDAQGEDDVAVPEVPEDAVAVHGPWDDPTVAWPDPFRGCVFLGGHPLHQRRRKNVVVVMRAGGLVIASGGSRGWSVHAPWHEVRRLDVQGADEVKFTHNHRIDLNGSALVVELLDGTFLLVEVRGRRPASLRSALAPIMLVVAESPTAEHH